MARRRMTLWREDRQPLVHQSKDCPRAPGWPRVVKVIATQADFALLEPAQRCECVTGWEPDTGARRAVRRRSLSVVRKDSDGTAVATVSGGLPSLGKRH
jgi:hypothetical protein